MNSAYVSFRKDAQQSASGSNQVPSDALRMPTSRQDLIPENAESAVQSTRHNSSTFPSSHRVWSMRSVLTHDQDPSVAKQSQHDRVESWPAMNLLGMDVGSKASILNLNASGFEIEEHDIEFLDAPGGFEVPPPSSLSGRSLKPSPLWIRLLWILAIGWWASLMYAFIGVLMFAARCSHVSRFCFSMSRWMLLPIASSDSSSAAPLGSQAESAKGHTPSLLQQSLFLKGRWDTEFQFSSSSNAFALWRFVAAPMCSMVHALAVCICWMLVVLLPMASVNVFMLRSLWDFKQAVPDTLRRRAYLLHLRFGSWKYCSYAVYGVNIIMLNLSMMVIPLVIRGYVPSKPYWFASQGNCTLYFVLGFIAVIPLGNFIHVSLYRLCSKTNPLYGFVANAIFHALIEIAVYIYLLNKSSSDPSFKSKYAGVLVNERLTGSMMFNLTFIPGVAMIVGGIRHFQQVFNRYQISTNSLLIFLSICMFVMPTLFQELVVANYFDLRCDNCPDDVTILTSQYVRDGGFNYTLNCADCYINGQLDPSADPLYDKTTRPITLTVSVFLPLLYVIGMVFSLRTHYSLIEEEEHLMHELLHHHQGQGSGSIPDHVDSIGVHSFDVEPRDDGQIVKKDAHSTLDSIWSKKVCVLVFISSLVLFGFIIEKVAESIPNAIKTFGFSNVFTAASILTWAPGIPDLILAILFARQNDISAAIDVGLAASLTVTMIQFPLLVWIAAVLSSPTVNYWRKDIFVPTFNFIDVAMIFLSFVAIYMVSLQGKSNYLVGLCLVMMYMVFLLINWYE